MHLCTLISRKKKSFTMRPQETLFPDTSTIVTYAFTHTLTDLRAYLRARLLTYSLTCILRVHPERPQPPSSARQCRVNRTTLKKCSPLP